MPGGLAMAATIPLDLTQYFVHVLRIEQKLAYLYGWHSFLDDDPDQEDDPQYHLALIIGFASGIGDVGNTVAKVGFNAARTGVAGALSRVMLPRVASKVVPVLSGAMSAGLTFSMFTSGAEVMRRYFAGLPQATDEFEVSSEVIDIEPRAIE